MVRRYSILFLLMLALGACGAGGATYSPVPTIVTPASNSIPATTNTPTAAVATLTVMTHDSFSMSEAVLQAFESANNVKVTILKAGDAGGMLNQAILSKAAPLADVLYGVDNTFLSRALNADIFEPYAAPALTPISTTYKLDPSNRLLPVDVGYVTINYDRAALPTAGITLPTTLRDLTKPAWKGKLVVENPAISSPGLAFLLTTITTFGESGDYTWRNFWRDLRANDALVSADWSDAYYTRFSGSSGKGPYPLVVSYSTSPAAEVFFSAGKLSEPPTANLNIPGSSFQQIEFVGILKGTKQRTLAERFVDFMLEPTFQNDMPLQMFVYPVNPSAQVPTIFQQFAQTPPQPATLLPSQIEQQREAWLDEWTKIMLR